MQIKLDDLIIEISFVYLFLIVILFLLWYSIYELNKKIKIEKRIEKFILKNEQEKNQIFFAIFFLYLVKSLDYILSKLYFLNNYSKKYQKYINTINFSYQKEVSFISEKIIIIIIIIGLTFLAKISFWYGLILIIVVNLLIENIYWFKYKQYQKKLNLEFAKTVTIMNNAFYSNKSIVQAIELVAKKTKGPLAIEFQRVYDEINIGLSIEEALLKMAKRIKINDLEYLAITLGILAQSGGDINHLFSRIQKRIYHQKEINMEIDAVTGGLKIMSVFLLSIPIVMAIGLVFLNPEYFKPLYSNIIGQMIIIIIISLYSAYVFFIKKIFAVGR